MPVRHAVWRIADQPHQLQGAQLESEAHLEQMIVKSPAILSSDWMLIGRQEPTGLGGRIDLLAIAPDASLVLIELKRNRTPREIVAQALDYASWVERLTPAHIAQIFRNFSGGEDLSAAFSQRFGVELSEEGLNQAHQIILVAAELDDATERIIGYLNDRDIAINVLFFQVFKLGNERLLSRAWMIDPGETQANATATQVGGDVNEPWNGEYYVSFGHRSWEDARRYGYISGGGGPWYSQTLRMLAPGHRVWVRVPGTGYVGVGRVTEAVQSSNEFTVATPQGSRPVLDVISDADRFRERASDPALAEYFVRVQWIQTVPEAQAVDELGLFGNQNTVCRPTAASWRTTIERLKILFPDWNR
jgi:uncharacterized protein YeaO (DUF488 family)